MAREKQKKGIRSFSRIDNPTRSTAVHLFLLFSLRLKVVVEDSATTYVYSCPSVAYTQNHSTLKINHSIRQHCSIRNEVTVKQDRAIEVATSSISRLIFFLPRENWERANNKVVVIHSAGIIWEDFFFFFFLRLAVVLFTCEPFFVCSPFFFSVFLFCFVLSFLDVEIFIFVFKGSLRYPFSLDLYRRD